MHENCCNALRVSVSNNGNWVLGILVLVDNCSAGSGKSMIFERLNPEG